MTGIFKDVKVVDCGIRAIRNAIVRHFFESMILNGNQAAMIVINLFRAGRVSEITDNMLRDLNYWYNKERSRGLAEFRRLVVQYGACESPNPTIKDLDTAMLINTMKGLDLEERVQEIEKGATDNTKTNPETE